MTVIERWTIYVCTGCGLATGRHKDCDAVREATEVVAAVEYEALEHEHEQEIARVRDVILDAHARLAGGDAAGAERVLAVFVRDRAAGW